MFQINIHDKEKWNKNGWSKKYNFTNDFVFGESHFPRGTPRYKFSYSKFDYNTHVTVAYV